MLASLDQSLGIRPACDRFASEHDRRWEHHTDALLETSGEYVRLAGHEHLVDSPCGTGERAIPAMAPENSVRPGINHRFKNPDVNEFVGKYEGESREVFARRKEITAACMLKPGMAVADIGAGTGFFTRLFAQEVGSEGIVYGVDIAPKFIDHVEKMVEGDGLNNVVGVVCTVDDVRLPAHSIDVAFVCDTYHHFEFPFQTLASIHEALRPGGQLIVIDFHRTAGKCQDWVLNHVRADQAIVIQEITSSGYQVVGEEKMLKENYFIRFEKIAPKAEEDAKP